MAPASATTDDTPSCALARHFHSVSFRSSSMKRFIPEDEPFACDVFDDVALAATYHLAMDRCHAPLILSVPDGRIVVTSLTNCGTSKRRAVGSR